MATTTAETMLDKLAASLPQCTLATGDYATRTPRLAYPSPRSSIKGAVAMPFLIRLSSNSQRALIIWVSSLKKNASSSWSMCPRRHVYV